MKVGNNQDQKYPYTRLVKGIEYSIYEKGLITESELFTHIHVYFTLVLPNRDLFQQCILQIQECTTLRIIECNQHNYLYTYFNQTHSQSDQVLVFENTIFGRISKGEQTMQIRKLKKAVNALQSLLQQKQNEETYIEMGHIQQAQKDIFKDFLII